MCNVWISAGIEREHRKKQDAEEDGWEDKPLSANSKVDLTRLPPFKTLLLPHVQRMNYRLCSYKKVHILIFDRSKPYDSEKGWV